MKRFMQISTILLLVLSLFFTTAQTVDAASPIDGFDPGADGAVTAMAVQADGKILVGGSFNTLGGAARGKIGRLNVDGSLDGAFNPDANGAVYALLVQPDGKILVGGDFTTLGGQACNHICRLNANGDVETNFNLGAGGPVYALALQSDGKILVGGDFTTLSGGARSNIGRLSAAGSLDTFNPGASSVVNALAVQADGKILVGGDFTTLGAETRNRIGRLNIDGSLDTFNPGASGVVNALAVQADGKIVVGGDFTTLGAETRNRIGRLNVDGSLDTFNLGADAAVSVLIVQVDGKILLGGDFTALGGQSRSAIARLNAAGSLDTTFNPGANAAVRSLAVQADGEILVGGDFTTLGGQARKYIGRLSPYSSLDTTFNPGANNAVYALALQPDGKVLVGGNFSVLAGVTRGKVGWLNADGTLDTSFTNPLGTGMVYTLVRQPDGKIVVGGAFTTLGGAARNNIGRLNADGSLDTTFNPGANSSVFALALQPDGKILVGGEFTTLGWDDTLSAPAIRNNIGRLNADGSLDTTFNPGANKYVDSLVLQPDGKILVGGVFTTLGWDNAEPANPVTRESIGRLYPDGSPDMDFDPVVEGGGVRSMVVEPDGQIVVGGWFARMGGEARSHIGRVNADGTLDTTFNPGANEVVRSLALQADGKIVVGGSFTTLGFDGAVPASRNYIGRLNPDGSLDMGFNPDAGGGVIYSLAVLPDGKILVGGVFSTMGGQARSRFARLSADTPALQSMVINTEGTSITWLRSGSAPEVQRVTFEISTDASTYSLLGTATRVSGGWRLSGLSLPQGHNLFIRARGYYQTGLYSASNSVIEYVRNICLGDAQSDPVYSTTTSLSVSPGSATYGTSVTLTATVTTGVAENPYAVGQVQFKDGSTDLGSPVTLTNGQATYTTSILRGGSHTLKAEFLVNEDYLGSASNEITYNVAKAAATVTLGGLNQTYNGATRTATATTSPAGLSVTFVYTAGSSPVTPKNAGSYTVVATINNTNYQGSASGTLVIAPAGLTVSGITASDKIYNGLTTATLNTSGASLVGVVSGDQVTLNTSSAAGTFADKNVGPSKPVTINGVIIGGAQAANYALTQPTATASINAKVLSVSAEDKGKVYGESLPVLTASYSGFENGETAAVLSGSPSLTTTAAASSPVGIYPITVTKGTLSAQNYTFTFPNDSGHLVISKADSDAALQLSANAVTAGTPVTLTVTVGPKAPGAGVPTGQVTFKDGTTSQGTRSLVDGKAQLSFSSQVNGAHSLSVSYAGDGNFNLSDSTPVTLLVSESTASADLTLTMSASPTPVVAGSDLVYTLTVTNQGPSPATGVTLADTLPEGVTFKSAALGCGLANGVVNCPVGTLANGASATIQITVTVREDVTGSLVSTAQATGMQNDPLPANNRFELSVAVTPADVYIYDNYMYLPIIRK